MTKTPTQIALREFRHRLAMTQQEFSDLMGVTTLSVARWENARPPSRHVLAELAHLAHHFQMPAEITDPFDQSVATDPYLERRLRRIEILKQKIAALETLEELRQNHLNRRLAQAPNVTEKKT
jgi:transcriptional regulator with XRE-family HTH domain